MDGNGGSSETTESTLPCAGCVSRMLPARRLGLMIGRCTGCVGISLDRGEVEQLIGIDDRFDAAQPQQGGHSGQQRLGQSVCAQWNRRRAFLPGLAGQGHHGGHHGSHHGR